MITCTRRLTFEAGHRVYGHESKCAHPHGHSYKVEIKAYAKPRHAGPDDGATHECKICGTRWKQWKAGRDVPLAMVGSWSLPIGLKAGVCCDNKPMAHLMRPLSVTAAGLDTIGRVIDFSVLKQKIGTWIDENWDHAFIYNWEDGAMIQALSLLTGSNGEPCRLYQMTCNPTAENLANHLLKHICPAVLEGTGVEVRSVRVWETENCYADASLDTTL